MQSIGDIMKTMKLVEMISEHTKLKEGRKMKQRPFEREWQRMIVETQDYMNAAQTELENIPTVIAAGIMKKEVEAIMLRRLRAAQQSEQG